MLNRAIIVGSLFIVSSLVLAARQAAPVKIDRIDPVAVVGCLQELKTDEWTLVNASEPVPSNPTAASAKELATLPKGGTRAYRLIGVTIFNLPAFRGQTVVVKGLPVTGKPMDRLNMTSVSSVAASCPGTPQKPATI